MIGNRLKLVPDPVGELELLGGSRVCAPKITQSMGSSSSISTSSLPLAAVVIAGLRFQTHR